MTLKIHVNFHWWDESSSFLEDGSTVLKHSYIAILFTHSVYYLFVDSKIHYTSNKSVFAQVGKLDFRFLFKEIIFPSFKRFLLRSSKIFSSTILHYYAWDWVLIRYSLPDLCGKLLNFTCLQLMTLWQSIWFCFLKTWVKFTAVKDFNGIVRLFNIIHTNCYYFLVNRKYDVMAILVFGFSSFYQYWLLILLQYQSPWANKTHTFNLLLLRKGGWLVALKNQRK